VTFKCNFERLAACTVSQTDGLAKQVGQGLLAASSKLTPISLINLPAYIPYSLYRTPVMRHQQALMDEP
jgi:hypothetical protein